MKICLISNLYKPYARGGAETVVDLTANGLRKSGHQVFIITTRPAISSRKLKEEKEETYYIRSFYYNLNKIPKLLRFPWHIGDMFDFRSFLIIKNILKKEKPDVVITHCLKGIGYLTPWLIRILEIKHVHVLHDIQLFHPSGLMYHGNEKIINGILPGLYQAFCRFLFRSPDIVISPSNWLMKLHSRKSFFRDSKKFIFYNPINISGRVSENSLPSSKRIKNNSKLRFLYVGQIEDHKGILFLINTFNMLCNEIGSVRCELLVVGDGSKLKQARKLAGKNFNIKLLGRKRNDETLDLMQGSDCLIVPSLCYDNSPMVIYEAFSVGLPVIASHIGGIPELLYKDYNLLFEPNSKEDLIRQMKWSIENKNKLPDIAGRGWEKIKDFSINKYVEELEKLF